MPYDIYSLVRDSTIELEAEGPAALLHRDCARPAGLRIPVPLAAGALATKRNGWDKTADMRSISWLFRTFGFASELEAEGAKKAAFLRNAAVFSLRRDRDSNPRYDFVVYTLSRRDSLISSG